MYNYKPPKSHKKSNEWKPSKKYEKLRNEIFNDNNNTKPSYNEEEAELPTNFKLSKNDLGYEMIPFPDMPHQHFPSAEFFDGNHVSISIYGSSGCGKTRLLSYILPILCSNNDVCDLVLCSCLYNPNIYPSINAFCNTKGITYKFINTPDEAYEYVQNIAGNEGYKILVFDDFTEPSKSNPYSQCQSLMMQMLRQCLFRLITITQCVYNLPIKVRNNCNTKFYFKQNDEISRRATKMEYESVTGREDFNKLYNILDTIKYSYVLCSNHRVWLYVPNKGLRELLYELN